MMRFDEMGREGGLKMAFFDELISGQPLITRLRTRSYKLSPLGASGSFYLKR